MLRLTFVEYASQYNSSVTVCPDLEFNNRPWIQNWDGNLLPSVEDDCSMHQEKHLCNGWYMVGTQHSNNKSIREVESTSKLSSRQDNKIRWNIQQISAESCTYGILTSTYYVHNWTVAYRPVASFPDPYTQERAWYPP